MREVFNTKKSLNKMKYGLPLFGAIAFLSPGIYFWFRYRNITLIDFATKTIEGFCLGLVLFFIMWIRYRNVIFEITDEYISKMNNGSTVRSVSVKNVKYYFYTGRGKSPTVKVENQKDFDFEMTLGSDREIVTALERIGISKKV
jgi:hypothetical protein